MQRKLFPILIISVLVLAFGVSAIARAQEAAPPGADAPAGSSFTYQGQLKNADGPVTASCDFQFGLWDALTGGAQVGSTLTQTGVAVSEGLFTVQLDFGVNAFTGSARWLEIAVRCPADSGAYNSLSPRQPLTPAPYSLYSANADTLDGQHAAAFASTAHTHWGQVWYGSGTGLTLSGDIGLNAGGTNYGVEGYASSTYGRGIFGSASATTGFTFGIYGGADSTSGTGVFGIAGASSGFTNGVYGFTQSTSGTGVLGVANATAGSTFGVSGMVYATNGIGVYGWAYASTGNTNGVYGVAYSTSGRGVTGYNNAASGMTYGVYGQVSSNAGTGVYGTADSTSGVTYGVEGLTQSSDGAGIFGLNSATTGRAYGILGSSASTSGIGIYGSASALTGQSVGIYGKSDSTDGIGVEGSNWSFTGNTYGVVGSSLSTSGVGVFGQADYGYGFGVEGYSTATIGTGVYGHAASTSGASAGVWGETESTDGWGVYGEAACINCNYGVYSRGNLYVTGNSTVAGTKSAVVQTQDYGWVDLYSMESPRVLFEDINTAQLVNGTATVTIDPVFAQTVDLSQPYQVFPSPNGNCSLYVSQKTSTSFSVASIDGKPCSISFDYRIIAVRKGYTDTRLESAQDPEQVTRLVDPAPVPPEQKIGDQP
jgi:hypothetical protein